LDVHFGCTQCGDCCRKTKIPLTAHEAADWLSGGNEVQVICEASPWLEDRSADDPEVARFKRRSFDAVSGPLPIRVVVMLVANIPGDCPNLTVDARCGAYERRPLVCQIYPAEINPHVRFDTAKKACPTAAWAAHHPLLFTDRKLVGAELQTKVDQWRAAETQDLIVKRQLCSALQISDAAVAQEGFLVFTPPRDVLLRTLDAAIRGWYEVSEEMSSATPWRFVTDRADTAESLARKRAVVMATGSTAAMPCQYIGFKRQPAIAASATG
jgi:Fe-S-cluster containining protein